MRLRLDEVKEKAKVRPAGYLEEVIGSGRIEGDWLELDDEVWRRLFRKYRGLGDVVAAIAKPVAAVIDKALGTGLSDCAACRERQEALNRIVPLG